MKKTCFLLFFIIGLFLSCTSSNSAVALGANLQNYQYAYVLADIQRTPIILDIEKKIFEGLQNSRLQMIYVDQIDNLTDVQRKSLLRVLLSYSGGSNSSSVGTVVGSIYVGASSTSSEEANGTLYIFFQDHNSKNIVASCSGIGMSVADDVRMVIKESLKLFPNNINKGE